MTEENLAWIVKLKDKGYKYMVRLSKTGEVWATKGAKKKDGEFKENSRWDVFELEPEDAYMHINDVIVPLM